MGNCNTCHKAVVLSSLVTCSMFLITTEIIFHTKIIMKHTRGTYEALLQIA